MHLPKFSVIIPAYNQAKYLPDTLQSVLDQTMPDFEVIIVNDASPDNTTEVVQRFTDPRVKLIVHSENKRLPATRNTGMQAAQGEYIALLDSDDLYHPEKLEVHARFLEQFPDVDVTYNSRFELNYSDTTIRELVRPPLNVGLRDLIYGYPFTPSDMVIRKNIFNTVGGFDESLIAGGEDLEYPARLALAGCNFVSVDRALNYRRHHSGLHRNNLEARIKDVQDGLNKVYTDPRCPEEIRQLGEIPLCENYLVVAYLAFLQDRTEEGQRFLRKLIQINPKVLQGNPSKLSEFFTNNSTADENECHEEILKRIFFQLPDLPVSINDQLIWSIQQGYLIKGVRAALWDRKEAAKKYFQKADNLGATFSGIFLNKVAQHVINFEAEVGFEASHEAISWLLLNIELLCEPARFRSFQGELSARRAFENFSRGKYERVPGNVVQAIRNQPHYFFNRGMQSILIRSMLRH